MHKVGKNVPLYEIKSSHIIKNIPIQRVSKSSKDKKDISCLRSLNIDNGISSSFKIPISNSYLQPHLPYTTWLGFGWSG